MGWLERKERKEGEAKIRKIRKIRKRRSGRIDQLGKLQKFSVVESELLLMAAGLTLRLFFRMSRPYQTYPVRSDRVI